MQGGGVAASTLVGGFHDVDLAVRGPVVGHGTKVRVECRLVFRENWRVNGNERQVKERGCLLSQPESRPCTTPVWRVLHIEEEETLVVLPLGFNPDGEATRRGIRLGVGSYRRVDLEDRA